VADAADEQFHVLWSSVLQTLVCVFCGMHLMECCHFDDTGSLPEYMMVGLRPDQVDIDVSRLCVSASVPSARWYVGTRRGLLQWSKLCIDSSSVILPACHPNVPHDSKEKELSCFTKKGNWGTASSLSDLIGIGDMSDRTVNSCKSMFTCNMAIKPVSARVCVSV